MNSGLMINHKVLAMLIIKEIKDEGQCIFYKGKFYRKDKGKYIFLEKYKLEKDIYDRCVDKKVDLVHIRNVSKAIISLLKLECYVDSLGCEHE